MTALLVQSSRWRDVADDAALIAAARELSPVDVVAATAHPARTARITGIPSISAEPRSILRAKPFVDAVVVVGGRPLSSEAARTHLFGLHELSALTFAFRAAGKRMALVGVGADALTSRRDAFLARQIVVGSALTVVDGLRSVAYLTAAGVPSPLRVGADLAWLELQKPPRSAQARGGVWLTLTKTDLDVRGGAEAVARELSPILASLATRIADPHNVTVQAWRAGAAAGDDLDAASEVVDALRIRGLAATMVPPPVSLDQQRDLLRGTGCIICAHPHALMVAGAAGVPLLAWPDDPHARAVAEQLEIPMISDDVDLAVRAALLRPGASLPVVRQQVAAASEVADLLKVLLTRGVDLPRSPGTPAEPLGGVRPTGVLR